MKPLPIRLAAALAIVLAAPACVPRPAPPPPPRVQARPTPTPTPTPTPAPVVANWLDAPQTPGDWSYRTSADRGIAAFGPAASEPRFVMRCERAARSVVLVRYGPATGTALLTIRTESQTRTLSATPASDGAVEARLAASDRLLDAMALTKGRFAVETPGAAPLYLPSWAEVTRVIEDCR